MENLFRDIKKGSFLVGLRTVQQLCFYIETIFLSLRTYCFLLLLLQPDREDELMRIEGEGGKVINWNGARVFGVLAMSRAIGFHLYFST